MAVLSKVESLFVADTKGFDSAVDRSEGKVKRFSESTRDYLGRSDTSFLKLEKSSSAAGRGLDFLQRHAGAIQGRMAALIGPLTSVKTLIVGLATAAGGTMLARSFIEAGSSADIMKQSLDTLTQGRGEEWFERLNKWALKMPVNTQAATQAFITMKAMGMDPSIEAMTTLVDTASALGGGEETINGLSRALGQMASKGKVSSEELLQMAERGVPAAQILQEKLGLTAEQVGNIGKEGIKAEVAIAALLEGMNEKYGGTSAKIAKKWSGMIETLKSYWTEFKRLVMSSGVMQYLENRLSAVITWIDELYETGKLELWAQEVSDAVVDVLEDVENVAKKFWDWVTANEKLITQDIPKHIASIATGAGNLVTYIKDNAKLIGGVGLVGYMLFGPWGAAALTLAIAKANKNMDDMMNSGRSIPDIIKGVFDATNMSDKQLKGYFDDATQGAEGTVEKLKLLREKIAALQEKTKGKWFDFKGDRKRLRELQGLMAAVTERLVDNSEELTAAETAAVIQRIKDYHEGADEQKKIGEKITEDHNAQLLKQVGNVKYTDVMKGESSDELEGKVRDNIDAIRKAEEKLKDSVVKVDDDKFKHLAGNLTKGVKAAKSAITGKTKAEKLWKQDYIDMLSDVWSDEESHYNDLTKKDMETMQDLIESMWDYEEDHQEPVDAIWEQEKKLYDDIIKKDGDTHQKRLDSLEAYKTATTTQLDLIRGKWDSYLDHINRRIDELNNRQKSPGMTLGYGYSNKDKPPVYDAGGYVPRTELALVHQGEFILSRRAMAALEGLNRGQTPTPAVQGGDVHIHVTQAMSKSEILDITNEQIRQASRS